MVRMYEKRGTEKIRLLWIFSGKQKQVISSTNFEF